MIEIDSVTRWMLITLLERVLRDAHDVGRPDTGRDEHLGLNFNDLKRIEEVIKKLRYASPKTEFPRSSTGA